MTIFKAVWLSISRRLSKSLILFGIVFLMGNLLCASISISHSMGVLKEDFLKQLGHQVKLERTYDFDIFEFPYEEENRENLEDFNKKLEELKKENIIQYFDNNFILNGLYSNELVYKNNYIEQPCDYHGELLAFGISEKQLMDVQNQKIELTEGRTFTDEEMKNGEHKIIISNQYYYQGKEIKVNDKIPLNRMLYDEHLNELYQEKIMYEVIGKFEKKEGMDNTEFYDLKNYAARIYMPQTTVIHEYEQLKAIQEQYPNALPLAKLELNQINIKLKDYQSEKRVESLYKANKLIAQGYKVKSGKNIYDQVSAPLETMSSMSTTLTLISSISMVTLLSITIFIFLKDRRYEVGVLYAMGEKQIRIIIQHVLETLVISITAITLAMFSGQGIAKSISNKMIAHQTNSTEFIVVEEYSQRELLNKYEIHFDQEFIGQVYGTTIIITALSSVLPIAYILRLKPKKILM